MCGESKSLPLSRNFKFSKTTPFHGICNNLRTLFLVFFNCLTADAHSEGPHTLTSFKEYHKLPLFTEFESERNFFKCMHGLDLWFIAPKKCKVEERRSECFRNRCRPRLKQLKIPKKLDPFLKENYKNGTLIADPHGPRLLVVMKIVPFSVNSYTHMRGISSQEAPPGWSAEA